MHVRCESLFFVRCDSNFFPCIFPGAQDKFTNLEMYQRWNSGPVLFIQMTGGGWVIAVAVASVKLKKPNEGAVCVGDV